MTVENTPMVIQTLNFPTTSEHLNFPNKKLFSLYLWYNCVTSYGGLFLWSLKFLPAHLSSVSSSPLSQSSFPSHNFCVLMHWFSPQWKSPCSAHSGRLKKKTISFVMTRRLSFYLFGIKRFELPFCFPFLLLLAEDEHPHVYLWRGWVLGREGEDKGGRKEGEGGMVEGWWYKESYKVRLLISFFDPIKRFSYFQDSQRKKTAIKFQN